MSKPILAGIIAGFSLLGLAVAQAAMNPENADAAYKGQASAIDPASAQVVHSPGAPDLNAAESASSRLDEGSSSRGQGGSARAA